VNFKREGVSRESSFVRGQWRDTYHYALLREEWKETKNTDKNHVNRNSSWFCGKVIAELKEISKK
jgi:hypothetical protein